MQVPRKYTFNRPNVPYPGGGYGKYYAWSVKIWGRDFFLDAVQLLPEELPEDPWGPGNLENPDDFHETKYY